MARPKSVADGAKFGARRQNGISSVLDVFSDFCRSIPNLTDMSQDDWN